MAFSAFLVNVVDSFSHLKQLSFFNGIKIKNSLQPSNKRSCARTLVLIAEARISRYHSASPFFSRKTDSLSPSKDFSPVTRTKPLLFTQGILPLLKAKLRGDVRSRMTAIFSAMRWFSVHQSLLLLFLFNVVA
jgi:hypothetical protein